MAAHYVKVNEADDVREHKNLYGGQGTISARYFPFDGAPEPARFVIYDIPPGASEGVHSHDHGPGSPGAFDEYYYIIAGSGEMTIEGNIVAINTGDHVHVPLGLAHGIANTMPMGSLRVFLTYISR